MSNYIIIENSIADIVESCCTSLSKLYAESGFVNSILVFSVKKNKYRIEFPDDPDFEHFAFFVNYFRYPIDIENVNPLVYGIWEVSNEIVGVSKTIGEKLVLFVSKEDKNHDNVSVQNSKGEILIYGFDGKIASLKAEELNYLDCIKSPEKGTLIFEAIYQKPKEDKIKPWWKFW